MSYKLLSAQKKLAFGCGQQQTTLDQVFQDGYQETDLAKMFEPLWDVVSRWGCYFYVTDGWKVYPMFMTDGDQIISKTYMTCS